MPSFKNKKLRAANANNVSPPPVYTIVFYPLVKIPPDATHSIKDAQKGMEDITEDDIDILVSRIMEKFARSKNN